MSCRFIPACVIQEREKENLLKMMNVKRKTDNYAITGFNILKLEVFEFANISYLK